MPVYRSIRLELLILAVLALIGSGILSLIVRFAIAPLYQTAVVDYRPGMELMDAHAQKLAKRLGDVRLDDHEAVQRLFSQQSWLEAGGPLTVRLVNPSGQVLVMRPEAGPGDIDLFAVVQTTSEVRADRYRYRPGSEYVAYYPVDRVDARAYLLLSGVPPATPRMVQRFSGPQLVTAWVSFVAFFFLLTRGKIRYVEELADGLLVISRGNLQHRVEERGRDELGVLARSINQMAAALEENIEAERRSERTKNELITGVSHDLRTPLTSIKGYLHLLLHTREANSPEQAEQYMRIAHAKAEQLQEMVESLFEYTKLSGQEARLTKQEICLSDLLAQMVEEYVPLSESHQLTFTKRLSSAESHTWADPDLLARVFDNLLTNAIKYSDQPGTIQVWLEEQDDGFLVTVENHGPAIVEGELEQLFNPFFRLDRVRSAAGGSGLGLAIARSIVTLHGGRIWADSEGGLVRFHVWLPRHP